MNSNRKGKEFERTVAALLRECGFSARRTQQFCGTEGAADITSEFPAHIECKHSKRPLFPVWWRKVVAECGDREPIIVYRINNQPIRVAFLPWHWIGHDAVLPTPSPGGVVTAAPGTRETLLRTADARDFFLRCEPTNTHGPQPT